MRLSAITHGSTLMEFCYLGEKIAHKHNIECMFGSWAQANPHDTNWIRFDCSDENASTEKKKNIRSDIIL